MTELRTVLARPEIQAKIEEGKRLIHEHREAKGAGKQKKHTPLLTNWGSVHQKIIEDYIGKVITLTDQALASLGNLSKDDAWSAFWQIEDKQGELTQVGDTYKRQFERLIGSKYLGDSAHGGPLYHLFDAVCIKVVTAVFKLKFGA